MTALSTFISLLLSLSHGYTFQSQTKACIKEIAAPPEAREKVAVTVNEQVRVKCGEESPLCQPWRIWAAAD
jgi:hypothetical protein